ncbi:carbohydrate-binding protein [Pontiellaceae bacterium B1224]|nr:carbohydrate-binding protein [Pontiellaceae bacterium B1224]
MKIKWVGMWVAECIWALSALVFVAEGAVSENATFVHPGLSHKRSDLDRMKAMVEAQIDPWYTSYQTMAAESKASYNYTVQGNTNMTVLLRDAPKTNLSAFESDSRAAYYNTLRWYIEGDSRYADKAVEIFNAWTGLTYMGHTGTRALTSSIGYQIIEAAEIIKSTYSGWSTEDIDRFKAMLVYPGYSNTEVPATYDTEGTFYWRAYLFDYVRAGNQEISAMRVCMALGIFLDNEIIYDRALRYAKGLPHRSDDLPYSSGPHTTGSEISNDGYRISYNYTIGYDIEDYGFNGVLTNYIWETGQAQESSRDLWHTWWGMHMLGGMSEMAWSQGENLWGEADSRILLGSEYHNRYCVSYVHSYPDQPTEWTPTAASGEFLQQFDRTGRTYSLAITPLYNADPTRIYRDRYDEVACWELNVGHYVGRGLKTEEEAKWTLRARDTAIQMSGNYETKPASGNGSYLGYGGLTYRRPDFCYGDPIRGFDANGLPMYSMNDLPGTIQAENFDYSPVDQNGRTYNDTTAGNYGGEYRPDEDVDIAVCSEGGYALTDLQNGEWVSYTVHVPTTGKYKLAVRYAGDSEGTVRFSFGGSDVTGDVILPTTGNNWTTYTVAQNITLNQGVQSMRIHISGGAYELDSITISEDATGTVPVVAPHGLSAAPESASQLNLMWAATVGASVYVLKRSTNSGGPYDTMVFSPSTTVHSDTGLLAGTNYYYVVSALYDGVESTNSLEVMAVPSAPMNPGDVVMGEVVFGSDGEGGQQLSVSVENSGLGHNYQLLSSGSLTEPAWKNASDVLAGNGGELLIAIPVNGTDTNLFYKLEAWRQ